MNINEVMIKRFDYFEYAMILGKWYYPELLIVEYKIDKKQVLVHRDNIFPVAFFQKNKTSIINNQ